MHNARKQLKFPELSNIMLTPPSPPPHPEASFQSNFWNNQSKPCITVMTIDKQNSQGDERLQVLSRNIYKWDGVIQGQKINVKVTRSSTVLLSKTGQTKR